MPLDLDQYNNRVRQWSADFVQAAKSTASGMGITHRSGSPSKGASVSKIKSRVRLSDGAADRVSISFPRSLVYPHKGAGKGMGGSKGSRWIDKYGNSKKTNPASLGKMNSGGRKEKPFLNTALDGASGVTRLADIAAEELGAAITNNLFIN